MGTDLCEILPYVTYFKCLPIEQQKLPYFDGLICSVEDTEKGVVEDEAKPVVKKPIVGEKTKELARIRKEVRGGGVIREL